MPRKLIMKNKRFTREELWELQTRAKIERDLVTNPDWIMAYNHFLFSCTVLDAFFARSSVPSSCCGEGRPLEIGKECGWAPEQNCDCGCREA